jgi:hypothetical protein
MENVEGKEWQASSGEGVCLRGIGSLVPDRYWGCRGSIGVRICRRSLGWQGRRFGMGCLCRIDRVGWMTRSRVGPVEGAEAVGRASDRSHCMSTNLHIDMHLYKDMKKQR